MKNSPIIQNIKELNEIVDLAHDKTEEVILNLMSKVPLHLLLREVNEKNLFHYAAERGFIDVIKKFTACEKQVIFFISRDENGQNALMLAAKNNHLDLLDCLLDKYSHYLSLTSPDNDGNNAFILAVERGHKEVVEKLYKYNFMYTYTKNLHGVNGFLAAVRGGHKELVEYFLKDENYSPMIGKRTKSNYNALMLAILQGHEEIAEIIIINRPVFLQEIDINFLYKLIQQNLAESLNLLLEKKSGLLSLFDIHSSAALSLVEGTYSDKILMIMLSSLLSNNKSIKQAKEKIKFIATCEPFLKSKHENKQKIIDEITKLYPDLAYLFAYKEPVAQEAKVDYKEEAVIELTKCIGSEEPQQNIHNINFVENFFGACAIGIPICALSFSEESYALFNFALASTAVVTISFIVGFYSEGKLPIIISKPIDYTLSKIDEFTDMMMRKNEVAKMRG